MKDLISKLCSAHGISGFEKSASQVALDLVSPYADKSHIDKFGNVIAYKYSEKKDAKTVMLDAHVDQIGFVVTDITDNGFIKFASVGGVDPRMLLSMDVLVHGSETLRGVVCTKPPHLTASYKDAVQICDMAIDIGYSKEQAEKLAPIGTPITFAEDIYCLNDSSITGKCLDDRSGIASIIYAMEKLSSCKLDVNIVACFSVCEEVSGMGSIVSTYDLKPDFAIAVDVTHAKTPDAPANKTFDMGKILIGVGPNFDKKLADNLIKTCKTYDIPHDIEVCEGHSGTNAWYIQVIRGGVPVSLISIPLKYMHTPIETISICDVKNTGELIYRYLKDFREDRND